LHHLFRRHGTEKVSKKQKKFPPENCAKMTHLLQPQNILTNLRHFVPHKVRQAQAPFCPASCRQ
jgi:hypothetical protein